MANLPLWISDNAIFVGPQRDASAVSYVLINPAFTAEAFRGCYDPLEVYDFSTPTQAVSQSQIDVQRVRVADSDYVRRRTQGYRNCRMIPKR